MKIRRTQDKTKLVILSCTTLACIGSNFGLYMLYYLSLSACFFMFFLEKITKKTGVRVKTNNIIILSFSIFIALFSCMQLQYTNMLKFITWFMCAFIGYCFFDSNIDKEKYGRFIVLILSACAVEGIIQMITGKMTFSKYLESWGEGLKQGIVSIFLQHIVWGYMTVLGIVLVMALFDKWKRIILLALFFVNLYGSQCRAAWLACVVYFAISLVISINQKHKGFLKKHLGKVLAIIILLLGFAISKIELIVTIINNIFEHLGLLLTGQARYRFNTILALFKHRLNDWNILHHLFGSGYGSSANALEYYNLSLDGNRHVVDNQIISIYYEFGLIAFAFLIFVLVKSISYCIKKRKGKSYLLSILFIVNFCMSLVFESFGYQVTAFVFFFVLGARIAQIGKEKSTVNLADYIKNEVKNVPYRKTI